MEQRRPADCHQAVERVSIRVVSADRHSTRDVALPIEGLGSTYRLRLRSLTGARTTQVPFVDDKGNVLFRLEIPCESDEPLALDLIWDPSHGLLADVRGKRMLRLPGDDRYAPPPPLRPVAGPALDLCFLIDGTAGDPQLGPLLAPSTRREEYIARLAAFSEALRGTFSDLRSCVVAFGDHQLEDAEAEDLKPNYLLFPRHRSSRRLQPLTREQLVAAFQSIQPTPGGDFVDALGDGLHACDDVGWRAEARRILVVSGDSPGFSMTHPAPTYADAHVREHDVDVSAARLHALGVEIMTIYHRPANPAAYEIDDPAPFLRFAQEQFMRLASYPALSFDLADFDGAMAAGILGAPPVALGRDTALGVALDL